MGYFVAFFTLFRVIVGLHSERVETGFAYCITPNESTWNVEFSLLFGIKLNLEFQFSGFVN